jgi:hypothetical protein
MGRPDFLLRVLCALRGKAKQRRIRAPLSVSSRVSPSGSLLAFSASLCLCGGIPLGLATPAWGQGGNDRVFPPGGQRGTTVTLTFPAMASVESATLLVDGPGVKPVGPFVKGVGQVELAPDAAPGLRQVRLVGPKTATTPRPFAVGTLPELLEKEPNDAPEQAQALTALPVVLNGSLAKPPDVDVFTLALKKGDFLVIAAESRRTGAPTNLSLGIRTAGGERVPVEVDVRKRDPVFTCRAPSDGTYRIELTEITNNMGGGSEEYHYRLMLTTGPWLGYLSPAGARHGTTAHLSATGWNLGGQSGPSTMAADVPIPADAPERFPVSAGGAPNSIDVATGDRDELAETEPNETPAQAQPLAIGATMNGVFGKPGDRDCYALTAKKGDVLRLDVDARELDSFADAVMVLQDGTGRNVVEEDDPGPTRDPRAIWTAPADGTYTLILRDFAGSGRGGPEFYYRLTVAPITPELRVLAREAVFLVKPGEKTEVSLSLRQAFQPAEVTLTVEGLPPGVTAAPVTVAASPKREGTAQAKLVLTAAKDAAPGWAAIRIVAKAGGLSTTARWAIRGDGDWTYGTGDTDRLVVLVPTP